MEIGRDQQERIRETLQGGLCMYFFMSLDASYAFLKLVLSVGLSVGFAYMKMEKTLKRNFTSL